MFHGEKNLVINNKELKYSGIFVADEIFSVINNALGDKGYIKTEKKSEELVTPAGKMLFLELRPYKEKTHYATLMIKIKIVLDNVTEIIREVDGVKKKFQQGDVVIAFDSWLLTDYEGRWGMKPWAYFLKGLINKFIYTAPLESGFFGELVGDTAYIYVQAAKLLNSYRGKAEKVVSEEKVKAEMEEEIKKEQR